MKINYKIDAENKNFYIMENPKISGVVERRFPREYQCVPLSNDGFKIISLENQLQIYTGKISDHTIEGVEYTNAFEFCKELSNTIYVGTGGASEPLGAECETAVYTKDCDREALMTQLELHLAELVKIYGAVDGLELTTENIRIEAGQINLNTDEVENLLTELKNLIELKGSDCTNAVFVKDCGTQDLLDKLDEVIAALNDNSQAEQALLTSIDTKLDELVLIKDELVTANTTLTGIKTDTAQINTNLEVVIDKLDLQVAALEYLKVLVTETNTKLDTANATLTTISTDISTIKTDIGLIKTDVSEIKTDVKTIINKLDAVVNSLTNIETKLDAVVTELQTINTTLQTEFDQTQAKLEEVKNSIEFAHDIFQPTDCEGNNIGAEQNVIKVVQLANQNVAICNVQELADAINSGAKDYTSVLNSIDTKASNLQIILTELQTANTTLIEIKTDTTATNEKLDTLITKATDQLAELVLIKGKIEAGNLSLAELVTLTTNIDANITLIKNDVAAIKADISEIKADVKLAVTALNNIEDLIENSNTLLQAIKDELDIELIVNKIEKNNGTINYIQRDTVQWDSENGIEIDTLTEYSVDGINWTATAPAGDVILGYLTPQTCIENKVYELSGDNFITFEPSTLNSCSILINSGMAKLKMVNETSFREEGSSFEIGFSNDDRLLPNEVVITNKDASSLTTITVLQVCGYDAVISAGPLNRFVFSDGNALTLEDFETRLGIPLVNGVLNGNEITFDNVGYSVPDSAFNRVNLTSIKLDNSVTSIGDFAFQQNLLTSVTLPNALISIGEFAFGNNQLTSITIPDSVTSIGRYAFGENQLTSFTLPDSFSFIQDECFVYNQITSLVIPNNITSIRASAFQNNLLTELTIPNTITSIGGYAFGNNQLTSITILCDTLGDTTANEDIFKGNTGRDLTITAPIAMQTSNNGGLEGDLEYLANNNTVTFNWV